VLKNRKTRGFVLITVLFMVVILLIMMTSLISLTTETLYRVNRDMVKNSIFPLSDSAITEVLIHLENDPHWGENNEFLFMLCGDQDVKCAGLEPSLLTLNSELVFDKGSFYISFNPSDPAFKGEKYFSVNNLHGETTVPGWRPDQNVPPHTADIVITVAKDDTVRHVEVLLTTSPHEGFMKNGSRGKTSIETKKFLLASRDKKDSPCIHSNYDPSLMDENSMEIISLTGDPSDLKVDIRQEGTISSTDELLCEDASLDPSVILTNQSTMEIPELPISTLINGITFEPSPIPSGTYEVIDNPSGPGKVLRYTSDIDGSITDYPPNKSDPATHIVPDAVRYKRSDGIDYIHISKDAMIEYDPNHIDGTGNLTIKGAKLYFVNKTSLYAPGDGTRDFSQDGAPYDYGNVNIYNFTTNDTVVSGEGNIYAMGGIHLEGKQIKSGFQGEKEDDIALYSDGDIDIFTKDYTIFKGLIYTYGDFRAEVGNPNRDVLKIQGALIAAGKDPDTDPDGALYDPGLIDITASKVQIYLDDTVLGSLTLRGSEYGFKILSWYEF